MPDSDPRSQVYRHTKTGGLYTVLANNALLERSPEPQVVYRSLKDGQVWVRPWTEFYDGRYKCIPKDELLKAVRGADEY